MTTQEIIDKARSVLGDADIEDDAGTVRFVKTFSVDEDEEPHDAADELAYDIAESLRAVGLCLKDRESDSDSVWGEIVEAST